MNLVEQAFRELYPNKTFPYESTLTYSGHFKGYNANIQLAGHQLCVSMSKQWRAVSKEIRMGCIQELMVKLFKTKNRTYTIDVYNHFLKHVHKAVPKTQSHPVLAESFHRVNETYFCGLLEKPNLVLTNGVTQLGWYDYGTDTVSISKILTEQDLRDYVMYHELLHKKHKFTNKNGRVHHHTKAFRDDERQFANAAECEHRLQKLVGRKSILRWLLP